MTTISDILEEIEARENRGTQKSSHTTNPTTCQDVRRGYDACGICGSYNLVEQGVRYCKSCGKEEEDLLIKHGYIGYQRLKKYQNKTAQAPKLIGKSGAI